MIDDLNLLITGGCGFIGSNFINYYFPKQNINKLVNLDAMYYNASENNVDLSIKQNNKYVFVKGNLNDVSLITNILKKYQITHIIHFAAQSHVQNSFYNSLMYTNDNILGTHNLLECCRIYGKIKKFIHVSTDEVYGESINDVNEKHKTELSILCPTNPYAATKAASELIAQSYAHSFNLPIVITRGNNVFGPNQYPEKLIPLFIKLLKENKKLTIQGKGTAIYNIGCDEGMEYSVMDVAKILIKMIKNTDNIDEWIEYIEDRPFNDQRYYISNEKLKQLGWSIKYNLINGLTQLLK